MSSTHFSDGASVTASYMNTMYNTGGGHFHDGSDIDGHARKLDLATETSGNLATTRIGLDSSSFDMVFSSANFVFDSDTTVHCNYTKLTGDTSSIVWLSVPFFSGTSNGTALRSNTGDIPAAIRPPTFTVHSQALFATNGSTQASAVAAISTTGLFTEYLLQTPDHTNVAPYLNEWTMSGTKGNYAFIMCYPV